jgi:hypothetical protein
VIWIGNLVGDVWIDLFGDLTDIIQILRNVGSLE